MSGLHKLKPLQIARELSPGRYGDGGGLCLQVGSNETKSWIFRYEVDKREREMGLGAYPATTLALAIYSRVCSARGHEFLGSQLPLKCKNAADFPVRLSPYGEQEAVMLPLRQTR